MRTVIISDLDGTLLDPLTYSFERALPVVNRLKERAVPLIFCSSKTRSEIEYYRERLGNSDPFISENGGGLFIPEQYFPFALDAKKHDHYLTISVGRPYPEVRSVFSSLREKMNAKVRGFGDMTPSEIAALTSLPFSEAVLASKREFDEPFIFESAENQDGFLGALEGAGLKWTKGTFYHATGDNDKGMAAEILKRYFREAFGMVHTIGLGDSLNDLPLLRAVDVPVLVKKKDGKYERGMDVPGLILARGIGPEGWVWALESVLRDI